MDVEERIRALRSVLTAAAPGSTTSLLGSRAAGTADDVSDIDLAWRVPDADRAFAALPETLARIGAVESLRIDPATLHDPARRLVFVRFAEWSLFERVDLDIGGGFTDSTPDWVRPWSAAESALMNVIAVVKAQQRGRGDVDGLLERGSARIGIDAASGSVEERVTALVTAAEDAAPDQRGLAARITRELVPLLRDRTPLTP